MTTSDVRTAHKLLDRVSQGRAVLEEEISLLRSFLPELPAQKTLEEITAHVYDAWLASSDYEFNGNEYDPDVAIEDWLLELHRQLKGVEVTAPAHPEFLETEADYENAPEGTIVACDDTPPCHKFGSEWSSVLFYGMKDDRGMSRAIRRVLRWGWGE